MEENQLVGCIYIIKNLITNKYYVGQTRLFNPIGRWKDHFNDCFKKNTNNYLYNSIKKYGIINFCFQIIEDNIPIELLDEKERYYIEFFDSYNNGYNETIGGQDGEWHSKLTEEQVKEIIKLIKENEMDFGEIANIYNVDRSTISAINTGKHWNFSEIQYPIINKNKRKNFSEEEIQEIYELLKQGFSARYIGELYNVSNVNIININKGYIYKHDNIEYPIYRAVNSVPNLEVKQIKQVIKLLLTTNDSCSMISRKLNIGRKTISNINNGIGYLPIIKQLGYNDFPLRKQ